MKCESIIINKFYVFAFFIKTTIDDHEKTIDSQDSPDLTNEYLKAMRDQAKNEDNLFRRGSK